MALNDLDIAVPLVTDAFDPDGDMRELGDSLAGHVVVPVANAGERDQKASLVGASPDRPLLVWRQDAEPGVELEVSLNGTTWRPVSAPVATRLLTGSLSGTLSSTAPPVALVPNQTIPAHPLGVVDWRLTVKAKIRAILPSGSGATLRVTVDGNAVGTNTIAGNGGSSATFTLDTNLDIDRSRTQTGDFVVRVELESVSGTITVNSGGLVSLEAKRRIAL